MHDPSPTRQERVRPPGRNAPTMTLCLDPPSYVRVQNGVANAVLCPGSRPATSGEPGQPERSRTDPVPFEEADFTTEVELLDAEEQANASGTSDQPNNRKTLEVVTLIVVLVFAIVWFAFLVTR